MLISKFLGKPTLKSIFSNTSLACAVLALIKLIRANAPMSVPPMMRYFTFIGC